MDWLICKKRKQHPHLPVTLCIELKCPHIRPEGKCAYKTRAQREAERRKK